MMHSIKCDVAIIGAGPAGLAAAIAARKEGAKRVLVVERDNKLGGILQQCIHPGFGLTYFHEELTGPEYAERFIDEMREHDVDTLLNSMVLEISPDGRMICANPRYGMTEVRAKSVVLAMGCRERTRGQIQIPGTRPAGVYTAGAAQRLINRQNEMVGKEVVILGSGDIGMIMARRLTLEGAKVVAVVEIMDFVAGLTRNKVQCLNDFDIPLLLSHTVTEIVGNKRVEGVYVARVDNKKKPIEETRQFFKCDTLLLSVGLIPENELSAAVHVGMSHVTNGPIVNQYMQTSIPAIFASGNVVHVNDLADNVSRESETAGRAAALFAMGRLPTSRGKILCKPGKNVRYICPHHIDLSGDDQEVKLYFRVIEPASNVVIRTSSGDKILSTHRALKVNPGEMECVTVRTTESLTNEIAIDALKE